MRRRALLTEDRNKYLDKYLTFIPLEDGTFTWNSPSSEEHELYNDIEFSLDGGITWNALEHDTSTPTVEAGNEIMFKGLCKPFVIEYERVGCGKFSSTCQFNVEGNIMSLLFGDDFKDKYTLINEDVQTDYRASHFRFLFLDCNVVNAKNLMLPATELTKGCYANMFSGCINLTEAPVLLATTLTNLCYYCMFDGCASLTEAPELPATELTEGCYADMFGGCTSLTKAPVLRATILQPYCYSDMFYGCTSLNEVKCLALDMSAEECTIRWMDGVGSDGTFFKAETAEWTRGTNGIPEGWSVSFA